MNIHIYSFNHYQLSKWQPSSEAEEYMYEFYQLIIGVYCMQAELRLVSYPV